MPIIILENNHGGHMYDQLITDNNLYARPNKNVHFLKLRSKGFKDLIINHNWSLKGGFGEKLIRGRIL